MDKEYKFKGKQFNITEELAEDLGVNKATDFIFQSKELAKHAPYNIDPDCVFKITGVNDCGHIGIRVYEVEP